MSSQDSLSLAGKVAIITGSGRENGIGAGIALKLAGAGARVVLNYVSESTAPRAAKTAENIEATVGKGKVLVVQADVSSPEGATKIADMTLKGFDVDHIDILVNNAALGGGGPVLATDHDTLRKMFEVNAIGPVLLMQAVVPHMPRGGRIVNIGSVASDLGIDGLSLYGASKKVLSTLSFGMAKELGQHKGITINTITLGPVITDSFSPDAPPQMHQLKDILVSMTRADDRPGTVDDVSDVALFLASEKSRWITGQDISVSGGITC